MYNDNNTNNDLLRNRLSTQKIIICLPKIMVGFDCSLKFIVDYLIRLLSDTCFDIPFSNMTHTIPSSRTEAFPTV